MPRKLPQLRVKFPLMPRATRRPKTQNLVEVTLTLLRKKLEEAEHKLKAAETALAARENEHLKLERRANSAEAQMEACFNAIRILASVIPPMTAQGRKVRAEARQALEEHKVTPPSTLGSSRDRKPVKRSLGSNGH